VRKRVQDAVTDHARLLELVDEPLAASWLQRLGALVLHSADLADLRARAQTFALTINTLIDACDAAHMTHVLRPVALFLARAHVDAIPERFDVRAHAVRVPGVTSMADRDEVLQLIGAIHAAARRLDELRARLVRERYGDERHEEAQVVVRMLDDVIAPHRQGIDTLARRLSGAVG
jgi:hypothetical protein